jgi:hypothetical protein
VLLYYSSFFLIASQLQATQDRESSSHLYTTLDVSGYAIGGIQEFKL